MNNIYVVLYSDFSIVKDHTEALQNFLLLQTQFLQHEFFSNQKSGGGNGKEKLSVKLITVVMEGLCHQLSTDGGLSVCGTNRTEP